MKISVLDAITLGDDLDLSMFEQFGEVRIYPSTSEDEFLSHVGDSEVLILNKLKVGRQNLPACKSVKLICITATGFDNVDLEYCREAGIAVCNVVGYSTQNVAQITVAMALSLRRHLFARRIGKYPHTRISRDFRQKVGNRRLRKYRQAGSQSCRGARLLCCCKQAHARR